MKLKGSIAYTISICILFLFCCSCNVQSKSWSKDDFQLTVDVPKTKLTVGETMKVSAELKNISSSIVHFSDNGYNPSIFFYDSTNSDPLNRQIPDFLAEHTLKPNEHIKNSMDCTAAHKGKYVLQIDAYFTIDGKEYHMNLDDIYIDVE